MTGNEKRVRRLRVAARRAGYQVHYDRVGRTYSLHGRDHLYGLTIGEAEGQVQK